MHKIGLHFPGNSEEAVKVAEFYNLATGMDYEIWKDCDGELYVAASHEDVGQITWWDMSRDELKDITDDAESFGV